MFQVSFFFSCDLGTSSDFPSFSWQIPCSSLGRLALDKANSINWKRELVVSFELKSFVDRCFFFFFFHELKACCFFLPKFKDLGTKKPRTMLLGRTVPGSKVPVKGSYKRLKGLDETPVKCFCKRY